MPSASAKFEKIAVCLDAADPVKQFTLFLEKKVRNLEKRKLKLDNYKNDVENGKELIADQKIAVSKYDQVVELLDFSKDLCKSLSAFTIESARVQKKLAKKEQIERQQHEIQRLQEALYFKHILASLDKEEIRNDFLAGDNGAVKLDESDLSHLSQFSKLVGPNLPNDQADIESHFHGLAENLIFLVDGRNKEIAGTTYKSLKDVLQGVKECGYFSRASETSDVSSDDAAEPDELVPEKEVPSETDLPEDVYVAVPEEAYVPAPEESHVELEVLPEPEPEHSQELDAVIPVEERVEVLEESGTFAVQNGCLHEVLSSQGNFNFLQDSQIELDTPHMDPAVIAVHQIAPQMNFVSSYPIPQLGDEQQDNPLTNGNDIHNSPPPATQQIPMMTAVDPRTSMLTSVQQHGISSDFDPSHPIPTQTFTNQNFAVMQNMIMSPTAYVPVTMHHGPLPAHITPIAVMPGLAQPAVSSAASVMPLHVPLAPVTSCATSPIAAVAEDLTNHEILNGDIEQPIFESVPGNEADSCPNMSDKTNDNEGHANNFQRSFRGNRWRGRTNIGYYRGRGGYHNGRGGYQGHNNYFQGGNFRRGNSRGRINSNIRNGRGSTFRSQPAQPVQQQ